MLKHRIGHRNESRHRRHRILACLILACGASVANAGVDGDMRSGYNTTLEEASLGGGVLLAIGPSGNWFANPNAEVIFRDSGDAGSINGDVHYDFPSNSSATYWLGAGAAIVHRNPGSGNGNTDLGLNLLAGLGARTGMVRPFVQGRVTVMEDTEATILVGVRF
jgi:hypothetical protein